MSEPAYLSEARTSYDTVAVPYAELVGPLFAGLTVERAMLGAFVQLVAEAGGGPIADLGCGPGYVTAYLHSLGAETFGVDLSPNMVALARRTYPALRFEEGSMTALDLPDGRLGGVVAWYSIIHTPPEVLPVVFGEFHRVLAPGGHLLLGFHVGDERRRKTSGYGGHPMSLDVHLLPPGLIVELAGDSGLPVRARLISEGEEPARVQQACLLFRKPSQEDGTW